jgi:hypothetical protein
MLHGKQLHEELPLILCYMSTWVVYTILQGHACYGIGVFITKYLQIEETNLKSLLPATRPMQLVRGSSWSFLDALG